MVKAVTDMAIKHRVPTASTARAFVDIGGLMSFGADGPTAFRHGAKFVQRILAGQAAERTYLLEQPTKFELAINLKTAKAIGLDHSRNISAACRCAHRMMMSNRNARAPVMAGVKVTCVCGAIYEVIETKGPSREARPFMRLMRQGIIRMGW